MTSDKIIIDYGRAEIQAFTDAVAAGEITYDPKAARDAANLYQTAVIELRSIRRTLKKGEDNYGFGSFPTGIELQQGFSNKATEGIEVINQLIEGAQRLQETYLRAGHLIEEADEVNRQRIQLASSDEAHGDPKS